MISARKSACFERLFAVYNRNLLARRFEGLRAAGLEYLRDGRARGPLVLYANHSSWWDGLVAFELGRACRLDQYVMMDERQLRAYPLFRLLGAFSVARGGSRSAAHSVGYAAALLGESPRRALWIFPQGETTPNDARPLELFGGAAHVIKRAGGAWAAPVAMRYEFLEDFRPEAFARVGPPVYFDAGPDNTPKAATRHFAEALTRTLERVRADILRADFGDYEELVAPRRRPAESQAAATPAGD